MLILQGEEDIQHLKKEIKNLDLILIQVSLKFYFILYFCLKYNIYFKYLKINLYTRHG